MGILNKIFSFFTKNKNDAAQQRSEAWENRIQSLERMLAEQNQAAERKLASLNQMIAEQRKENEALSERLEQMGQNPVVEAVSPETPETVVGEMAELVVATADDAKDDVNVVDDAEQNVPDADVEILTDGIVLDFDNQEFFRAADVVEHSDKHLFLSGRAGTGKTTLLKYIQQRLENKKNYVVLAPTGVAAVNSGGVTIHSFFEFAYAPYLPDDSRLEIGAFRYKKEKLEIIQNLETIIIDEISMVRCDVLDAMSTVLKKLRKSDLPFGGVQMVFIGDLFQLPPIANPQFWEFVGEYYNSEFFFEALALRGLSCEYIELRKIYRQTDDGFIDLLNKVRIGKLDDADFYRLNARLNNMVAHSLDGYITLSSHRKNVDSINREQLDKLPCEPIQFHAVISGEFPAANAPAEIELSVKVGAQVMILRNGIPRYYNGSMGVVERIEKEETEGIDESGNVLRLLQDVIYIRLFDGGALVRIERAEWENYKYLYNRKKRRIEQEIIGRFSQFPIRLAWAMTIHKSQGLTFDKVVVDAGNAFAHGQVYVALSRCRSLEGLILRTPILPKSIIVNKEVMDFIGRCEAYTHQNRDWSGVGVSSVQGIEV